MAALLISLAAGVTGAVAFARGDFLTGGGLLLAGVVALRWLGSFWRNPEPPELQLQQRLLLLLAIVAVGAVFRFYRMVPPGLWGDDAINGLLAFDVLDGKVHSPFQLIQHSANKLHALTNFLIAGAFKAFGPGLGTLRLPGVVLGFLAIPFLYGTFAPLFGARVALCATLFFATSPVQISHSKILIQVIVGEFFLLSGMCLLVQGLAGRRRWLIVLSGVPLGLMHCTYHSYKLAPAIALFAAGAIFFGEDGGRRFHSLRRRAGGDTTSPAISRLRLLLWCFAGLLVFAASAAPGVIAYIEDPTALTGRVNTSIVGMVRAGGGFAEVWDSIWRTLTIFHYQQGPRSVNWVGIGTDPAFGALLAALVCHGFGQSLARWKEPRHLILLFWFFVGLLPGFLSSEAPRIYRVLMAMPPLYVWCALPLERMLALSHTARSRLAGALAALILLAVPVLDFNYYFYGVYTNSGYHWTQASRMVDIAAAVRDRGSDWSGYLMTANFDARHETLAFLTRVWSVDLHDVTTLADVMPFRQDRNALVIADTTTMPLLEAAASFYPGAAPTMIMRPPQRSSWFDGIFGDGARPEASIEVLPLPRATIAGARGIRALYLAADGTPLGSDIWRRIDHRFDQAESAAPTGAKRVALSGALYVPRNGPYAFSLQGDGSVALDGQPLLSPDQRRASIDLAEGLHPIGVAFNLGTDAGGAVLWQPPGEGESAIPSAFLYRDAEVHGWLAEYSNQGGSLRRLEPSPRYGFFPRTFGGRYAVQLRGRLQVPRDGRTLEIQARGKPLVTIDGRVWNGGRIEGGVHDVEMRMENVEGGMYLDFLWRDDKGPPARIPSEAFLPPAS